MDWKIVAFCVLCFIGTLSPVLGVNVSSIEVQRKHVALYGDLKVYFQLASNSERGSYQIHLREVGQNTTLLTLYTGYGMLSGLITFPCGAIDHAGFYEFKLKYGSSWLATSKKLQVSWPSISFTLPDSHIALTDQVDLTVNSTDARCGLETTGAKYFFELNFETGESRKLEFAGWRENLLNFRKMVGKKVVIPCDSFDQAGSYRVVLRCSSNTSAVVAQSNAISVQGNPGYDIKPERKSIKPCQLNNLITISFKRPACFHPNDFLRLYSVKRNLKSSIISPVVKKKVREKRVKKRSDSVHFKCKVFRDHIQTYCFVYVSIAKTGAVHTRHEVCIPNDEGPDAVIDGSWGEWQAWSECTQTCGKGQRNRYRVCNNPSPSPTGKFCEGDTLERSECGEPCTTPKPVVVPESFTTPTLPPLTTCDCGCELMGNGFIKSSVRCNGTSIWLINVTGPSVVSLTFNTFNLNSLNQTLKVRDGAEQTDTLLKQWDDKETETPRNVMSTGNLLRIELWSNWPFNSSTMGYFINASFRSVVPPTVVNVIKKSKVEDDDAFWQSTGTIIGVVACIVIVLVTVALVLHHCVWKRRKREILKKQANGELPLDRDVHSPSSRFTHLLQPGSSLTSDAPSSVGGRKLKHRSQLNKGFKTFKGEGNPSSKNSSASSLAGKRAGMRPLKLKKHVPSPYGTKPEDFFHEKNIFTSPAEPTTESKFDSLKKRKHKQHEKDGHHKHEDEPKDRKDHKRNDTDDRDHKHTNKGDHHRHHDHHKDRKHSPDKHRHRKHRSKEKEVDAMVHAGRSSEGLAADIEVNKITGGVDIHATDDISPVSRDARALGKRMGPNVAIVSPKTKSMTPPEDVARSPHAGNDHEMEEPMHEGKGKALKRGNSVPKNKNIPSAMATIAENVALETGGTLKHSKGVTARHEESPSGKTSEHAPPVVQYPYFGPYPYYYAPVAQVDGARSPAVFYPSAAGTPPGGLPAHQVEGATHPAFPMVYPVMYACQGAGEGMAPYPQFMVPVSQSGTVSPTPAFSPVNEGGAQIIPIPAMVMSPHYYSSEDDHNAAHSTSSMESGARERRRHKNRTPEKNKTKLVKSPSGNIIERRRNERPDGKSPGQDLPVEKTIAANKTAKTKPRSNQSPSSLMTSDGMEYDDYLPNVPGSFLNNDSAYAMKWPRYGKPGGQKKEEPVTREVVVKENVV